MKLFRVSLLISATVLLGGACAGPAEVTTNKTQPALAASPAATSSTPQDALAVARATFQKECAGCHQADASGGPVTVEGKKLRVPTLREGHALKDSDEDFVKQITNGDDGMPAFKDKLTPEQINGLVRFIRKEFQGK